MIGGAAAPPIARPTSRRASTTGTGRPASGRAGTASRSHNLPYGDVPMRAIMGTPGSRSRGRDEWRSRLGRRNDGHIIGSPRRFAAPRCPCGAGLASRTSRCSCCRDRRCSHVTLRGPAAFHTPDVGVSFRLSGSHRGRVVVGSPAGRERQRRSTPAICCSAWFMPHGREEEEF